MTPAGCETDDSSWERRWGIPQWEPSEMTICISAICEAGRATINVGDDEVGMGFTATELGRTKWDDLCDGWIVGFAGPVSNAWEVIEWTRKFSPEMTSTHVLDLRALLEKSYRHARLERVESELLSSRGWTLQEFKDSGRQKMPDATYATIDARLALFDFGAELIASGWADESEGNASVITIKNPGVCIDHSRLGFWCIGSGATAAQMSLFSRNYSPDMNLEEALYYVIEAKIAAEKASGVGGRIDTFIEWKEGKSAPLSEDENNSIRAIYASLKQRDLTSAQRDLIGKIERIQQFKKREKSS